MYNLFLTGEDAGSTGFIYVVLIVAVLGMLVFPIFSGKKRQEQIQTMLNSIKAGDRIKTIGGIVGTVVEVKNASELETYILIESGEGETKSTLWFDIKAIGFIMSKVDSKDEGLEEGEVAEEAAEESTEEVAEEVTEEVTEQATEAQEPKSKAKKASEQSEFDDFNEFNR